MIRGRQGHNNTVDEQRRRVDVDLNVVREMTPGKTEMRRWKSIK